MPETGFNTYRLSVFSLSGLVICESCNKKSNHGHTQLVQDPLTIEKNLSINSSGLALASKFVSVFKYTESDSNVAS